MLSPTLSKPSCSMPKVGTSTFKSSPKTFPKPRRNCISIRHSETARSGRISPGIRENSGRGWTKKWIKQVWLVAVCVTPKETIHILFLSEIREKLSLYLTSAVFYIMQCYTLTTWGHTLPYIKVLNVITSYQGLLVCIYPRENYQSTTEYYYYYCNYYCYYY